MNSPQSETVSEVPVLGALEALFRASRQRVLYPDSHPLRQQALANAAGALSRLLAGRPSLLLSASEEGLEVAGQLERGPAAQRLAAEMRARLIASLDVSAGIAPEEIDILLGLLSVDPAAVLAQGGPTAFLGDQPTPHLRVEAVDFSGHVRESEADWIESLAVSLETGDAALENIVRLCLDTLSDAEAARPGAFFLPLGAQTGTELAGRSTVPVAPVPVSGRRAVAGGPVGVGGEPDLARDDHPAATLASLLQRSGESARGRGEPEWSRWQADVGLLFDRLPAELTARMFRAPAMVDQIGADMLAVIAATQAPERAAAFITDYPGAVSGESPSQLARALGRVMPNAARRREVEPHLRARLRELGMTEAAYLHLTDAVLDSLARTRSIPQDLAESAPGRRQPSGSGRSRDKLADLRATLDPNFVHLAHNQMLRHLLTFDHPPAAYASIVQTIARQIERQMAAGRCDEAVDFLLALGGEVAPASTRDAVARRVVLAALRRLAGARPGELAAAVVTRVADVDAATLAATLSTFGPSGLEALVRVLQTSAEPELRRRTWLTLVALADPGVGAVRQLLAEADRAAASHLIAEITAHPDTLVLSTAALDHRIAAIRQQVVAALGERPGEASEAILLRALRDSDPRVRRDSAASLGRLRSRRAITALSLLALERVWRGPEGMVREAAIRAVGAIGLPECCLALREILLHDGGRFRRGDWWRVLAAKSLAAIPGEHAEGILSEGARCRSAAVRRACEQALAGREREEALHDR